MGDLTHFFIKSVLISFSGRNPTQFPPLKLCLLTLQSEKTGNYHLLVEVYVDKLCHLYGFSDPNSPLNSFRICTSSPFTTINYLDYYN